MTNETKLDHVDPEILALFAMRALDAEESAQISTHVEDCAACRLEVEKIRGDLSLLALGGSPLAQPPARSKARLMAAIREESAHVSARSPSLFWRWAFASSGVLALALAGAVLLQRGEVHRLQKRIDGIQASLDQERAESQQARLIAELLKSPNSIRLTLVTSQVHPQPVAHTTYDQSKGLVLLVASNLAELPADKTYELWLLPRSGAAPIPAGLFKPDAGGNAQMLYAEIPSGSEAKGFAITVEPKQGSPAPTTTPLLVGLVKS
ncbi:MAG TPA: anti-sigma factor [Pseudacidobacterium sp.]|jgi:anti-sigma-K factor RskA|nr:anti-sigma factor [Pseudacidobacterium sp.]